MTTNPIEHNEQLSGSRAVAPGDSDQLGRGTNFLAPRDSDLGRETKPSFKTTELIVYVLSVLAVLIASLVIDRNADGQGFSAYQGWFLVTLLTIGYLISRGLAKSGSRDHTR